MDDSERIFLIARQMKKTGPASISMTIPPTFFNITGFDFKKTVFNIYLDLKKKALVIEPSEVDEKRLIKNKNTM